MKNKIKLTRVCFRSGKCATSVVGINLASKGS